LSTLRRQGYSLIELLVVLVIVGVLVMVGVSKIGSRSGGAVRATLDELEGTLSTAHKRCVATGRDVTIAVQGEWTSTNPFLLAYGDSTSQAGVAVPSTTILTQGLTSSEAYRFLPTSRDCLHAGVVVTGSDWWSVAASGNTALSSVDPFKNMDSFKSLLSDPRSDPGNLSSLGAVRISGVNKRFNTSFYIAVVGIRNGEAITGGPMGLIVVLNNGATIYKFYNPGSSEGNDAWRKL